MYEHMCTCIYIYAYTYIYLSDAAVMSAQQGHDPLRRGRVDPGGTRERTGREKARVI